MLWKDSDVNWKVCTASFLAARDVERGIQAERLIGKAACPIICPLRFVYSRRIVVDAKLKHSTLESSCWKRVLLRWDTVFWPSSREVNTTKHPKLQGAQPKRHSCADFVSILKRRVWCTGNIWLYNLTGNSGASSQFPNIMTFHAGGAAGIWPLETCISHCFGNSAKHVASPLAVTLSKIPFHRNAWRLVRWLKMWIFRAREGINGEHTVTQKKRWKQIWKMMKKITIDHLILAHVHPFEAFCFQWVSHVRALISRREKHCKSCGTLWPAMPHGKIATNLCQKDAISIHFDAYVPILIPVVSKLREPRRGSKFKGGMYCRSGKPGLLQGSIPLAVPL